MAEAIQSPSDQPGHLLAAQRAIGRVVRWTSIIRYSSGAENDIRNGVLAAAADRALDTATYNLEDAYEHEPKLLDEHGISRHDRTRNSLGAAALELQPELGVPRVATFDGMIGRAVEAGNLKTGGGQRYTGRRRNAYAMVRHVPGRTGFIKAYIRYTRRHGSTPAYDDLVRDMKAHGLFPWQAAEGFRQSFGGDYHLLVQQAQTPHPGRRKRRKTDSAKTPPTGSYIKKQRTFANSGRLVRELTARLSPLHGQPLTWSEVNDMYEGMYPLRHQVHENLDDQQRTVIPGPTPDGIPPDLWCRYYAPDIAAPQGKELAKAIVRLNIPRVTPEHAARLEAEYRPDRPFLSFMEGNMARTGNPDVEPIQLGGWDINLLNLLMIGELRTGRAVGRERLLVHSGLPLPRFERFFNNLIDKLKGPASPGIRPAAAHTIIRASAGKRTNNPHYRINPYALLLDTRPRE